MACLVCLIQYRPLWKDISSKIKLNAPPITRGSITRADNAVVFFIRASTAEDTLEIGLPGESFFLDDSFFLRLCGFSIEETSLFFSVAQVTPLDGAQCWVVFIRHQMEDTGLEQGGVTWTCPIRNLHFCFPVKTLLNVFSYCPNKHDPAYCLGLASPCKAFFPSQRLFHNAGCINLPFDVALNI